MQALGIEGEAYDSLLRKLPELNEHERKVISKHMKSIVNQLIKTPIKKGQRNGNKRRLT